MPTTVRTIYRTYPPIHGMRNIHEDVLVGFGGLPFLDIPVCIFNLQPLLQVPTWMHLLHKIMSPGALSPCRSVALRRELCRHRPACARDMTDTVIAFSTADTSWQKKRDNNALLKTSSLAFRPFWKEGKLATRTSYIPGTKQRQYVVNTCSKETRRCSANALDMKSRTYSFRRPAQQQKTTL